MPIIVNDKNKNIAMVHTCVYDGKQYTDTTRDIVRDYCASDPVRLMPDASLNVSYTVTNLFDLFEYLHDWEKHRGCFAYEEQGSETNVIYFDTLNSNVRVHYMTNPPHMQKDMPIDGDIVKIRMKKWTPCASEKWARQFIDIEKFVEVVRATNNGTYYVRDHTGRCFYVGADNIVCKARDRRVRQGMNGKIKKSNI